MAWPLKDFGRNVRMSILAPIISAILLFVFFWGVLWVTGKIIGAEGSWKNCAVLSGIHLAVSAVRDIVIQYFLDKSMTDTAFLFLLISTVVILLSMSFLTAKILGIGFGRCILLWLVAWGVLYVLHLAFFLVCSLCPATAKWVSWPSG